MSIFQKLVFLIFAVSYLVRTAIACFAMDQFITIVGEDKLGMYFSFAAILTIIGVMGLTVVAKKASSVIQFLLVHLAFVTAAILCTFFLHDRLQAQILFLCMYGMGIFVYATDWSVAGIFITPFESARLFPVMSMAAQVGIFFGTGLAIASSYGLPKSYYMPIWLGIELLLTGLGISLYMIQRAKLRVKRSAMFTERPAVEPGLSLLGIFKHYTMIPKIILWVFLWTFLYTAMLTLTGATFGHSGVNLTALYGIMGLSVAVLSAVVALCVYPLVIKWVRLGAVLLMTSVIVFLVSGPYLALGLFTLAIFVNVIFEMCDGCFVALAVSTKFNLYPTAYRDRIRLLSDILAGSMGAVLVGPLFMLGHNHVIWILTGLFGVLIMLGTYARKSFNQEMFHSLVGNSFEEKQNAVAVFDDVSQGDTYQKMLNILLNDSEDLQIRINVLDTFSSLKVVEPGPQILNLLQTTHNDSLSLAILKYFEMISAKDLDPFSQYKLLETLKTIVKSHASNVLRSLSVKLFIQNGDPLVTVGFVMESLMDSDDRIVANAVEGLNAVCYPGIIQILTPFLNHPVARVQANAIIALWKYPEIRPQVKAALDGMIGSGDLNKVMSGIYAAGEVRDETQVAALVAKLSDTRKELARNVPITLLKLGQEQYSEKVVNLILGDDEKQAINACWLALHLEPRMLNEKIVAQIYDLGEAQRALAIQRFSRCGGFCRTQLRLLAGQQGKLLLKGYQV